MALFLQSLKKLFRLLFKVNLFGINTLFNTKLKHICLPSTLSIQYVYASPVSPIGQ